METTQANREISISTPLGGDKLLFRQMYASEKLGQLFEFELELLSEDGNIKHEDLLAENVTVSITTGDNESRYFNGLVSRFSFAGTSDRFFLYRATLKPWFWLLCHSGDCRIFQEMSVPDIIKEIFNTNGYADFELALNGTYNAREYCVQYRETDFNFISRLMEQEGIYYYFKHTDGKHKLVMTDSVSSHAELGKILYFPPDPNSRRQEEHIYGWNKTLEVRSGKYALNDFNFETPKAVMESRVANPANHTAAEGEIYDYPGEYQQKPAGENYAKIRLEELQSEHEVVEGTANHQQISTGNIFTLDNYPRDDQNQDYLIISANYQLHSDVYVSGTSASADESFSCQFSAIDHKRQFRTQRVTPKPIVQGLQTAIVVGPSDEEIYTDDFGRIKVQFHWDRVGESDENSSCWVRVAQAWAGNSWGGIFLPRIGQEVIVSFLEGDPDRPIITGSVYNGDNATPYALPANKTQSGFKSRSSKDGNTETFNELRFEDKKDEEEIYIHAEKDFNRVVENNETLKVGFDKSDDGDQTVHIFNNQFLSVGNSDAKDGSQTTNIYKDRTTTLEEGNDKLEITKGKRETEIKGDDSLTIKQGNAKLSVETGKRDVEIKGDDSLTIKQGNLILKVSAGKSSMEAAQSIELKVSGSTVKIDPTSITLTTGGSSIKMEPAKITIKAPQVAIEADATLDAKSPMTTVKGDAMLTLNGGLTKIN